MTIRLQIDQIERDEWNLEHIKKHGITREEIETAIRTILMIKPSYKDRLVLFCASPGES